MTYESWYKIISERRKYRPDSFCALPTTSKNLDSFFFVKFLRSIRRKPSHFGDALTLTNQKSMMPGHTFIKKHISWTLEISTLHGSYVGFSKLLYLLHSLADFQIMLVFPVLHAVAESPGRNLIFLAILLTVATFLSSICSTAII